MSFFERSFRFSLPIFFYDCFSNRCTTTWLLQSYCRWGGYDMGWRRETPHHKFSGSRLCPEWYQTECRCFTMIKHLQQLFLHWLSFRKLFNLFISCYFLLFCRETKDVSWSLVQIWAENQGTVRRIVFEKITKISWIVFSIYSNWFHFYRTVL